MSSDDYELNKPQEESITTSSKISKVLIWNEEEAEENQIEQIGVSACGPTAVLNVLKALKIKADEEDVCEKIHTNLRKDEVASIPEYLFSRSVAGTTAEDLRNGIHELTKTNEAVTGRFFHFFPPRKVELLKWLQHWILKGAVPLATMNLQRVLMPDCALADAWHHQMVYGVSSEGVHLTNPVELVPEKIIMEYLTSDSVLLIRREDVVKPTRELSRLDVLIKQDDPRWLDMSVLEQVESLLTGNRSSVTQLSSHMVIPASYKAGITLFARKDTPLEEELLNATELEIKESPVCSNPYLPLCAVPCLFTRNISKNWH